MTTSRLEIPTERRGLREITREIRAVVDDAGVLDGLCTVFVRHTSASLVIQENADPSAAADLERWIDRLVPDGDAIFTHTAEGPDDMPSHVKSALTSTSLSIPILGGALGLGTWQGVFLWEHRRRGSTRHVLIHVA